MLSLVKLVFLREEIDVFPSSHFAWNRIVYTGGVQVSAIKGRMRGEKKEGRKKEKVSLKRNGRESLKIILIYIINILSMSH